MSRFLRYKTKQQFLFPSCNNVKGLQRITFTKFEQLEKNLRTHNFFLYLIDSNSNFAHRDDGFYRISMDESEIKSNPLLISK